MTWRAAAVRLREAPASRLGAVLGILLTAIVVSMERGAIGRPLGYAGSVVALSAGVAWVLIGRDRVRGIAELYLWLAFIVSLYFLHAIAETIAGRTGLATIDALRGAAVLHVALVAAAVWHLTRAGAAALGTSGEPRRFAAAAFIVGAVVFWVGARTFPGTSLPQVQADAAGHVWTSVSFMLATFITLAGLAALTRGLVDAGNRVLAPAGLALFTVGAVLWTLHLTYRLTVLVHAADEWHRTAVTPLWFEPWRAWAGALFAIYTVLAYASLAAFGCALLKTTWTPRWVGWSCIASGLVAAPLGGLPLFIHVPLWLAGICLLRPPPASG